MVAMKMCSISCNERAQSLLIMGMVVLQNYIDLLKVVPGSYSEIYLTPSHDGNQVINIKVEDFVGMQEEEEEDPLLIKFPVMKSEHEVSCMSVCTS
jgi:hypothetical protein